MKMLVARTEYTLRTWDGVSPPPGGRYLAIDTETEPIIKGLPLVPALMQVCSHDERVIEIVAAHQMDAYVGMLAHNQTQELVFHNAPFDLEVLGIERFPWIEQAVEQGRVTDTGLRFCLQELERGTYFGKWSLDYAAKKMLKIELDKDQELRTSFRPNVELSPEQLQYAAFDAAVTAQLREMMPSAYPTEHIQTCGFVALNFIGRRGMLVDQQYQATLHEEVKKIIDKNLDTLGTFGYRPGPGSSAVMQDILLNIEERLVRFGQLDEPFPRTPKTNKIKTDGDLLAPFNSRLHPFIDALKNYQHEKKMITNYCNPKYTNEYNGRVHPFFSPLKKTGRTSCSGPNLQNVPRKGPYRGVYIAPHGWVLYACDYSQLELCCLAQTCYTRYGESVMLDLINEGMDLHQWFGDIIMQEEGKNPQTATPEERDYYRQMAKACNFGFPGGLGKKTFRVISFNNYGVDFSEDQCEDLKYLWLSTLPEMKHHLRPPTDGRAGRWDEEQETWYVGATIMGRKSGRTTYCAACNYAFQGLASDGALTALWYLYKDRYRVVNFVHDESITELLLDDPYLQHHIQRINQHMVSGMKVACPDVAIRVEGALMHRWEKKAKPVHDEQGNLCVWVPDQPQQQQQEVALNG
jgi:DNA polymerase-1